MDKGIRPYVTAKFFELLPARTNTRAGNTVFRKTVMSDAMEQFSITLASASTHYNHSFIEAQKQVQAGTLDAALLEGLGRAPDRKGGRKPKAKAEVVVPTTEVLLLTHNGVLEDNASALPDFQAVMEGLAVNAQQAEDAAQAQLAAAQSTQADAVQEEVAAVLEDLPKLFNVLTKKDNKVVAEAVSEEVAREMVTKADRAKKAKLVAIAQ